MSKTSKSLSLIIPVYNEEKLIGPSLDHCISALNDSFENYEIILIDDGSKDNSFMILNNFQQKFHQIKVIQNNINLNQGISVQRGYSIAKNQYAVHNGIDLPLNPVVLKGLVDSMDDIDVLILERKVYQGASLWRRITSKGNILMRRILFPVLTRGVHDMNFTQIYRKEIIPIVMPLAKSPAFTTPEMIFRAKLSNLKVKTIEIDFGARTVGKGSLGKLHDILWSFYDMVRFRFIMWNENRKM